MLNSKNIACGLTLYNPSAADIENVLHYAKWFDKVYVYDNTEDNYDDKKLKNSNKIFFVAQGKNNGLGIACDELCQYAKNDGYEFIILFDQDSRMDFNSLTALTENIGLNLQVAIYCPQIVYQKGSKNNSHDMKTVEWCITSGSCVRLEQYGLKYKFDVNYFIDRLDLDFCRQITESGYIICQNNEAVLYQQLGDELHKIGYMQYSTHGSIRHYYLARNRLYYNHKFGIVGYSFPQTIKHILMILFYEKKKVEKVTMVYRGVRDYRMHRMGKRGDI